MEERKMSYQGWKNRATWNVALYLNNDEPRYRSMKGHKTYRDFIEATGLISLKTPDGVSYNDPTLDYAELTEVVRDAQ